MRYLVGLVSLTVLAATPAAEAEEPFRFKDGDRVVLIGGTLIEREQRSGYWETYLTLRHPRENITFRNLGWSGDNVWGEAQAGFGSPADGFRHLKDHVFALKPTVIIAGYGGNESFDGPAGLARFENGYRALLDALKPTGARFVLLTPIPHERLPGPLPDPTAHNRNLRLYRDAIRALGQERGCELVDLFEFVENRPAGSEPALLTDNGIHLTPAGYWSTAQALPGWRDLHDLFAWNVHRTKAGRLLACGATAGAVTANPFRVELRDDLLPFPLPTGLKAVPNRHFRVDGLAPGRYVLTIDGKPVASADATEWAKGKALTAGPEYDQAERLRRTIVEKNELYFHRWRPQNETYLFGFRKQEQGQNAREIPQFDPLVAAKEAEIATLRLPVPHDYQLVPEGK